jgi:vancomycin resistance protein YoaR
VLEYHAHSRLFRFNYLPPGLDAMVAWPDKDMRVRNPYPFPVSITAAAESGVLRVQLYGTARPFRVDYGFHVRERVTAQEIRRPDPVLARGDVRVQQEAFDGLLIARRRTVYTPLRRMEEETLISYPPVPRIVRFGTAARTK